MRPYIAKCDADDGVRRCPRLTNTTDIPGWTLKEEVMVDSSGWGQPGEFALTFDEFVVTVKKGLGYAITDCGQFQVYVGVYER